MSSDDTERIPPADEPTDVQPTKAEAVEAAEDETTKAEAPQTEAPRPEVPDAATGHIRVIAAEPPRVEPPEPRPFLRVGTVVWGLVIAAVGVGLLSISWGAHLDAQLALIVLLGAAGVALLVGSLVGMRRSRHRMEGRG